MNRLKLTVVLSLLSLHLSAQRGYPERTGIENLFENFQTPPEGYGEVPFYWWQADTLTKERLLWHLDELSQKKISSLQINYSHTDDQQGYFWGSSYKSQPAQFTDEWWDLFGWFMQEAAKRNMTVSVSDYTLGLGQGYALDEVRALHPDIAASQLFFDRVNVTDGHLSMNLRNNLISVVAFNTQNLNEFVDLTSKVTSSHLDWTSKQKNWIVIASYYQKQERTYNPMHPLAGKEYVRCFFQRFEDKFPETSKGKLNFFFSDELNFNLGGFAWDERFASEFQQRKGYDIRPYLGALTMDIGKITVKIRMDYNDVFTALSEENFFIPVYRWHADRNLIYGCDHGGRGTVVDEFGDYFRTQRWNQGPGSDQPLLGKDIIKAKVAASIAHMYNRPRVWLEGFYSSGWGTTSASLMDAIFANYAMGYNLLSLHGLYYATPGSMWEWAPPCNHFRMPYWKTMDKTLEAVERLSYLLSQGYHRCDVGILYPVEPKVAGYQNDAVSVAFDAGRQLYSNGVDFDFIDYTSLQNAQIEDGMLKMAGESYKAIVIPSMAVMKDSSLRMLGEFAKKGGIVINIGCLPEATDAYGKDEVYVQHLLATMTSGKNYVSITGTGSLLKVLDEFFVRDFRVLSATSDAMPYITHREIDDKEVYGVYNVAKGTECFFREKGEVEIWDVFNGKKYKLSDVKETADGTIVKMPLGAASFQIIVFTPSSQAPQWKNLIPLKSIPLNNEWKCEVVPVLDNRFGDFHYPGTPEKLRPEIRHYSYILSDVDKIDWETLSAKARTWNEVTYTYGDEFVCSGATDKVLDDAFLAELDSAPVDWKPYTFSRKWGVYGDAGHQGYHGLKMEMNPEVIRLGAFRRESTTTSRVAESGGRNYYLYTTVKAPYSGMFEVLSGAIKPSRWFVNGKKQGSTDKEVYLNEGVNQLILCYEGPSVTYFFLRDPKATSSVPNRLTLPWYKDRSILPFDPYVGKGRYGWYYFESAPGLESFTLGVCGRLQAWVNGKQAKVHQEGEVANVKVKRPSKGAASVALRIELPYGVKGGAGITSELIQFTGEGLIKTGDWGTTGGLRNYSGGLKYKQDIEISDTDKRIFLRISNLSSSVELSVNGRFVGTRVCPEWNFDITDYVVAGKNTIELTVYNTVANHYETIPTPFAGSAPSGLLGEVFLEYSDL